MTHRTKKFFRAHQLIQPRLAPSRNREVVHVIAHHDNLSSRYCRLQGPRGRNSPLLAQLRDKFAAEASTVMARECDNCGLPQAKEPRRISRLSPSSRLIVQACCLVWDLWVHCKCSAPGVRAAAQFVEHRLFRVSWK